MRPAQGPLNVSSLHQTDPPPPQTLTCLSSLNLTEAPGHGFFWPTASEANPSGCKALSAAYVPSQHTFHVNRCG